MSVSGELLCSFELLKPLDSSALKSHIKKGRNKRQTMLNSPVSASSNLISFQRDANEITACESVSPELLVGFSRRKAENRHGSVVEEKPLTRDTTGVRPWTPVASRDSLQAYQLACGTSPASNENVETSHGKSEQAQTRRLVAGQKRVDWAKLAAHDTI